jgi:hypothetical protein
MPKRSNDFQKLVFILKKHLAANANVTESKMLKDLVTGAEREVDICIEKDVAGHNVIISIECRDQARPADVGWIEKMKTKHDRLSTNFLALVSKSGFSKEADKVATTYGIETIGFDENVEESVSKIIGKLHTVWCKSFNLVPLKCVVEVEPVNSLPAETISAFPDNSVYLSDGSEICTIRDVVHYWLHSQQLIEKLQKEGEAVHKSFVFQVDIPSCNDGQRICMQKLEPKVLRPIKSIRVSGSIEICVSKIPLNQGRMGDVNVAWGSGTFIGKQDALLVAFKKSGESENIVLTLKENKSPTSG